MKPTPVVRFTICLAAVLLMITAGCPMLSAASEVRVQLACDALIIVPVTVNDEGPFYFLLDTGADTTIVDTALAQRLALTAVDTARQATLTGTDRLAVSRTELAVGVARVEGLRVLEQNLSGLRKSFGKIRIDGILGQDFLGRFNYLVDYRARSVRFEEGDDIGSTVEGETLPVEAGGKRMIVTAEAETRGKPKLRLLLDSGANAVVLLEATARGLRLAEISESVETSPSGAMVVRTGRMERLTVATREFRDVRVTVGGGPGLEGVADGLLPASLFQALYVNNARGFVVVNPRVRKAVEVAGLQ